MPEFAPVLAVSALNGANGFRLDGDAIAGRTGRATAGGGDVDGDGFADLLIGAPYSIADGGGGLAWVVFGSAAAPAVQGLGARVAAGSAYRFQGEASGDRAGFSISSAGDVNGDGFDDLIIGAHFADPDAAFGDRGASYLVFGGRAKLESFDTAGGGNDNLIALAAITPAHGYRFDGGADIDYSGFSVSGAGDVNGDGFSDLLIGAPRANPNSGAGNGNEGASYIVFGGAAKLADLDDDDGISDGRIDLAQISTGQGLRLDGPTLFPSAYSGRGLAMAGDVNGDGFGDALIGAPYADPNGVNDSEGAAYLVFGRAQADFTAGELDLESLDGLEGARFDGAAAFDNACRALSGLGDVNGDGFADIAFGARLANPNGNNSGSAFVVFGKSSFSASTDLGALDGGNGFRLDGVRGGDYAGFTVGAAGDVNGDGFGDILVGAYGFDRIGAGGAGAAYVIFGKASDFAAAVDLGSLDGDSGFRIEGAFAGDQFGRGAVGPAGDVNGDGFDDLVVGATETDNGGLINSGSTYIVYGHRAETAVTRTGTALDNVINGGKNDDTISGLSGDDTLFGWEDDDVIDGGSGNDKIDGGDGSDALSGGGGIDVFSVSGGEDAIDGGSGKDFMDFRAFAGGVSLNLALGTYALLLAEEDGRFASIEQLIMSNGNDTVVGSAKRDVINMAKGNDTADGGAGLDFITGGEGKDTLTGGAAADTFDYNAIIESQVNVSFRDTITDFVFNVDKIDLSSIDASAAAAGNQAFTAFLGAGAFTAEGQIRAFQVGASTVVEVNTAGTAGAEMHIVLANFAAANLDLGDFVG